MVSDSSRRGGQIAAFENTGNEDGSNGSGRILGGTGLSRRQLLLLVGQAGGFAAVNAVFGALTRRAAAAELPMVPLEGSNRVSVAILGAGIAGL
jgi:hypothetical protein